MQVGLTRIPILGMMCSVLIPKFPDKKKSENKKSITVHHLNYYEHLCGYLGLITERKLNGHRSSVDDPYYHHRTWIDPGGNFNIST